MLLFYFFSVRLMIKCQLLAFISPSPSLSYPSSSPPPPESGGVTPVKGRDESELPGPPSKPQVTDVTKNSVSLSWQPGLAGASAVSSYVIEAFRSVWGGVRDSLEVTALTSAAVRLRTPTSLIRPWAV